MKASNPIVPSIWHYLDYGNFKLINQVARNAGPIFHSHLVSGIYSWPLAPSTGIYWHDCTTTVLCIYLILPPTLFFSSLSAWRAMMFSSEYPDYDLNNPICNSKQLTSIKTLLTSGMHVQSTLTLPSANFVSVMSQLSGNLLVTDLKKEHLLQFC